MEAIHSMLHHAGLPLKFWAEAVSTAVYMRNQSPTVQQKEKTPFECFHKRKPEAYNLKVLGCNSHVHVTDEGRSNLDKKAIKCIFVGYSQKNKGYKFFSPTTNKMLLSYDGIFHENSSRNYEHAYKKGIKAQQLLAER